MDTGPEHGILSQVHLPLYLEIQDFFKEDLSKRELTPSQISSEPRNVSWSFSTSDKTSFLSRYMKTPSAMNRNGPLCFRTGAIQLKSSTEEAMM